MWNFACPRAIKTLHFVMKSACGFLLISSVYCRAKFTRWLVLPDINICSRILLGVLMSAVVDKLWTLVPSKNAEFQRIARRDKKAFLSDQCKEIEENNRMGKTRDLFKKIRDTKGTFHAKMGSVKKRQRNQRSNYQHRLDHRKSKRVPEKHLFLLYWLCQSLWLCGSQ